MTTPLAPTTDEIWSALAGILDPEFGIGIVDLGLIYSVTVEAGAVHVAMTLTTPTCPAGAMLMDGVQRTLAALPGVGPVQVDLVWEPAWTPAMLSDAARQHLDGRSAEYER
ncbi:MAG: metal-sulfur cluster assembly factor [Opitutae bacterium]|nr:metal-sulfur cluster assembly factor [Opitutae bacterium]